MSGNDRTYWERHAKNYDRSMALLGRPIPRMAALAGEAVNGFDLVLEVAAGTGLVTTALAGAATQVISTDYAEEMVRLLEVNVRAEGFSNVRFEQADIYGLNYEDSSFDAVVAANVLHLLPDFPAALASFRRVLKPGGRLITPTFCHDENTLSWLMSRALSLSGFPGHRRFTVRSLRRELEHHGLIVERSEIIHGAIPIGYIEGRFG